MALVAYNLFTVGPVVLLTGTTQEHLLCEKAQVGGSCLSGWVLPRCARTQPSILFYLFFVFFFCLKIFQLHWKCTHAAVFLIFLFNFLRPLQYSLTAEKMHGAYGAWSICVQKDDSFQIFVGYSCYASNANTLTEPFIDLPPIVGWKLWPVMVPVWLKPTLNTLNMSYIKVFCLWLFKCRN